MGLQVEKAICEYLKRVQWDTRRTKHITATHECSNGTTSFRFTSVFVVIRAEPRLAESDQLYGWGYCQDTGIESARYSCFSLRWFSLRGSLCHAFCGPDLLQISSRFIRRQLPDRRSLRETQIIETNFHLEKIR